MEANFPSYWMWSEAFEMLARAERMHRQFFQPPARRSSVAWEPPVDVLETERAVLVLVALPGVDFDEVKAVINQGELLISGIRTYPDGDADRDHPPSRAAARPLRTPHSSARGPLQRHPSIGIPTVAC